MPEPTTLERVEECDGLPEITEEDILEALEAMELDVSQQVVWHKEK